MTDQPPPAPPPEPAQPRQQCSTCVIIKVAAFAVFTAYVAADFATGGKITGWILGMLRAFIPGQGEAEE